MDLIVAVYDDWGIGCKGTQPVTLRADRKFFREQTRGAIVIAGRRTIMDFPGKQPLPNRKNIVLTRQNALPDGFMICHSPEEALAMTKDEEKVMVIGGGSVYRQMLPMCNRAYVTKVHCRPVSDTFFPNLDEDGAWRLEQVLCSGQEEGVAYQMCLYTRNEQDGEKNNA